MFAWLGTVFGNATLVAGTALGSIPVVIHLLNRQQYRRVWWAAMHWLLAAMKKAHRRIQVEQFILLLIRILILILLAMALARPFVHAAMAAIGSRPAVHRVIVLDNSFSMGHLVNNRQLFAKAKDDVVKHLIEKLTLSDDLDVVLANTTAEELPRVEGSKRADALRDMLAAQLSDGGSNVPKGIARACKILNESKHLRKEIIVVTDQTRNAWFSGDAPRKIDQSEEEAVRTAFSDPRVKPRLWIIRLHGGDSRENLAAAGLEIDEKVVASGVETQVAAMVRNCGVQEAANITVTLNVDGEPAQTETISVLKPNQTETCYFRLAFAEGGSPALSIQIPADGLPADNNAFLAVEAEKEIKVLCVDGQQRGDPMASEMDFFRQALAPSKAEDFKAGRMPLVPEVVSDGALPEISFDDYRLIVMGNVGLIPRDKIAALEEWVTRRGGSLWVWLGDRIDPAQINKDLGNLLPVTVGERVGTGDPESKERDKVSDKEVDHPAVRKLKDIKSLNLSQLETWTRFRLIPKEAKGAQAPRTVLRYENGEVAAAEWKCGEGRVLVVGTTADLAWNNWPGKQHYMPLVTFLALELIQPAHALRNRTVGEGFVYQLRQEEVQPIRQGGFALEDPAREIVTMDLDLERMRATCKPVHRAGLYTGAIPGGLKRSVHFAANRNVEESDLDTVEDKDILACLPASPEGKGEQGRFFEAPVTQQDVTFVGDELQAIEEALRQEQAGREIWRWLVGAVLLLLVLESLLAWRFGNYNR